jgi:hypothetical protein
MVRAAVSTVGGAARVRLPTLALIAAITACAPPRQREWIAGDHHVHSRYSVGWDQSVDPPRPIVGGDAIYPIPMNALMARHHGLSWMVATDHGGPHHSKVSLELSYPELLLSRSAVPEVIQFFGMELDTPGADHSSLIVPHTHDEAERLVTLEHDFAKHEAWPPDSLRDTEPGMLEALAAMSALEARPVVIANHPSRSASGLGEYGLDSPAELRGWNDAAPDVAVGMAGAPGHQALALEPDGSLDSDAPRGAYSRFPTMGGFDQLTARLGGFWDSMLGEGRRWWITANSDSHVNWREGGADFWPGEYSKTYVLAERSHDDILDGLRAGRIFVTTGDLVSEVDVLASVGGSSRRIAGIGGELVVDGGDEVQVTVRLRDPQAPNSHGDTPSVARVDLIVGEVTGRVSDPATDTNPTTRVARRFMPGDWRRDGEVLEMRMTLGPLERSGYLRVRGTNTDALEPERDPRGEDPWTDLWFYTNPVFLTVR